MTELTQATNFCQRHGVIITSRYLYHGPYFDQDIRDRAVWEITISRPSSGRKSYVFKFGQSLANSYRARLEFSGEWLDKMPQVISYDRIDEAFRKLSNPNKDVYIKHCTDKFYFQVYRNYTPPTEYDILAALTNSDPGTLEEFCSDYGYSPDSIRDNTTYKSVHDEWHAIKNSSMTAWKNSEKSTNSKR